MAQQLRKKSLWIEGPRQIGIKDEDLGQSASGGLGAHEVRIETLYSGISPGTEMLVYRGQVSPELSLQIDDEDRKRTPTTQIPHPKEPTNLFHYPIKYGYCNVGRVIEIGPHCTSIRENDKVFSLHPHESDFITKDDSCVVLPDNIDPRLGVFLANIETAIGIIHDSSPLLGENVVVFGLGIVGMLTSLLLSNSGIGSLVAVDLYEKRRAIAEKLGVHHSIGPETLQELSHQFASDGPDLVVELSGSPSALQTAIDIAGLETRIVVGSWYGAKEVRLDLGKNFHRNRNRIVSSQVLHISPALGARWTKKRRFDLALKLVNELPLPELLTDQVKFDEAAKAYEKLDRQPESTLQVILDYGKESARD